MAIDPSIALQVRPPQLDDPTAVRAKQLQLRDLMSQGQMRDMQMQQAQRAQQEEMRFADLYRGAVGPDGQIDYGKLTSGAASAGMGARIPGLQKQQAEVGKAMDERTKAKLELVQSQYSVVDNAMRSMLADPELTPDKVISLLAQQAQTYRQFPEMVEKFAIEARNLPNDPGALRRHLMQKLIEGQKGKEQLDALLPKIEYKQTGKQMVPVDTNALTNPNPQALAMTTTPGEDMTDARTRAEGAANRGVTMRGQDKADARAREANESGKVPSGYRRGRDGNLVFIPGGPADPSRAGAPKLTEDQGKATGWLVQATNAYTNMLGAMKDANGKATGAEKPGFGDAVSMVPLMGPTGNMLTGEARQKFSQAASSLSEALLRAATGAGVNKDEAAQKVRELTPQFGDGEQVRQQKLEAIPLYIESLKVRSGPGAAQAAAIKPAAAPNSALEDALKQYGQPR